jgi:enoyl-CoA hydratase/carnithine racemase
VSYSTLSLQQDGTVLRVKISNAPINLINLKMTEELFQLAGQLMADPVTNVVLLESADPDFFIAHFDLEDLAIAAADPSKASKYPDINALQSLALTWQALPQVTIAKVNGRCRGGGLEFILGLNMRFASEGSKFCFPEASAGFLASGGGATRVAFAAGPARATEILLSARDFTGEEAERYGLVNRCLPDSELNDYVEDLIVRLSARSRQVIGMHREVFKRAYDQMVNPMFAGLAAENDGLRAGLASADMLGAIKWNLEIGQTRENELDLPATLAKRPKSQGKTA